MYDKNKAYKLWKERKKNFWCINNDRICLSLYKLVRAYSTGYFSLPLYRENEGWITEENHRNASIKKHPNLQIQISITDFCFLKEKKLNRNNKSLFVRYHMHELLIESSIMFFQIKVQSDVERKLDIVRVKNRVPCFLFWFVCIHIYIYRQIK